MFMETNLAGMPFDEGGSMRTVLGGGISVDLLIIPGSASSAQGGFESEPSEGSPSYSPIPSPEQSPAPTPVPSPGREQPDAKADEDASVADEPSGGLLGGTDGPDDNMLGFRFRMVLPATEYPGPVTNGTQVREGTVRGDVPTDATHRFFRVTLDEPVYESGRLVGMRDSAVRTVELLEERRLSSSDVLAGREVGTWAPILRRVSAGGSYLSADGRYLGIRREDSDTCSESLEDDATSSQLPHTPMGNAQTDREPYLLAVAESAAAAEAATAAQAEAASGAAGCSSEGEPSQAGAEAAADEGWACTACTYQNHRDMVACEICGAPPTVLAGCDGFALHPDTTEGQAFVIAESKDKSCKEVQRVRGGPKGKIDLLNELQRMHQVLHLDAAIPFDIDWANHQLRMNAVPEGFKDICAEMRAEQTRLRKRKRAYTESLDGAEGLSSEQEAFLQAEPPEWTLLNAVIFLLYKRLHTGGGGGNAGVPSDLCERIFEPSVGPGGEEILGLPRLKLRWWDHLQGA